MSSSRCYRRFERNTGLSARDLIRGIIRKGVRCNRLSPRSTNYLMEQFPPARVNVQSPEPFYVKDKVCCKKATKVYLCLFVCLATKAVHLELATNLTTEAFLKYLQRLLAQRGVCKDIYSDNGTNFVGTRNEMEKIKAFLKVNHHLISEHAVIEGVDWHFIPSHAPHFEGLWKRPISPGRNS